MKKDEKVGDILCRAGIALGAQDITVPAVGEAAKEGADISVTRYMSYQTEQLVDIKYTKEVKNTHDLDKGTTKVIQKGSNGQKKQVYQVIVKDGVESRTLLREEVINHHPRNNKKS